MLIPSEILLVVHRRLFDLQIEDSGTFNLDLIFYFIFIVYHSYQVLASAKFAHMT